MHKLDLFKVESQALASACLLDLDAGRLLLLILVDAILLLAKNWRSRCHIRFEWVVGIDDKGRLLLLLDYHFLCCDDLLLMLLMRLLCDFDFLSRDF